jgi:ribosomal-protein-alanine N-acetyltransferase
MAVKKNTVTDTGTDATPPTAGRVVYRRARRSDLPRLAQLDNELYPVEGGWSLEMFEEDFANPNSMYMVATVDGQIVGYAACIIARRRGELTMNTVVPAWRGHGIGRELLIRRLRYLDRRVRTTVLQTRVDNDVIKNSYLRHGFKVGNVLSDFYHDGVDAVEMRRIRPTR